MPKSLLALAILMTQLLSGSGSPVYLCLDSDGSVCIDGGPDHCDCGHAEGSLHEHCCDVGDDCQSGEHDSRLDADGAAERPPCDCTHIQISETQIPVVRSLVAWPEASRVAAWQAAPCGCLNSTTAALDAVARWHGRSSPVPWPQSGRLCAVLRC
jgi:hypothetical protein